MRQPGLLRSRMRQFGLLRRHLREFHLDEMSIPEENIDDSYHNFVSPLCNPMQLSKTEAVDLLVRRERRVRFRCSEGCDFDLCGACMMRYRADSRDSNLIEKGGASAPSPSDDHKSNFVSIHPHELTISDSDNGWACDGKNTEEGCLSGITDFHQTDGMTRYTCNSCDFDLCSACFDAYRSRHAPTTTL